MRTTTIGTAGRRPLRWHRDAQRDSGESVRRGELAAGVATAAVASQLLFTPAVLLGAVLLVAVGRLSRWRPHWLAVPAVVSVTWLCAVGPAAAADGFASGSQRLAGFLLAAAMRPRLLAHPGVVAAGVSRWLPTGLPLGLLAACGEAWLVLWLRWWRMGAWPQPGWQWRPGLVTAVRGRMSAAVLGAGYTTTSDGCAIGICPDTGKLVAVSWAEATRGVLLAGQDLELPGLAITCAALRRRKTVVIVDCAIPAPGEPAQGTGPAVATRVADLARWLRVPVSAVGGAPADDASVTGVSLAGAIGRAIRRREVVLIATKSAHAARGAAADLAAVLNELLDFGLRADCVAWLNGGEFMDTSGLAELLAVAQLTGTVIVLSTTNSGQAAQLVSASAIVAVGHPVAVDLDLAARLRGTGDAGLAVSSSGRRGEALLFFMPACGGPPRGVTNCRFLPITADHAS